jgi:hypothetical protein
LCGWGGGGGPPPVDEHQNKSGFRKMRNVKIFRELRGTRGVFSFDTWIIQ